MIESWAGALDYFADLSKDAEKFNWTTAAVEAKDFLVHGALFGSLQTLIDASTGISKAFGMIPESFQPINVEQIWGGLPTKIQGAANAASAFFGKLDKRLELAITAFESSVSYMMPWRWDIAGTVKRLGSTLLPQMELG